MSYAPIRTKEFMYFLGKNSECKEPHFLKMLSLVAKESDVKNIKLTLKESEVSIKTEKSASDDVIKKIIKNNYKNVGSLSKRTRQIVWTILIIYE